MPTHFRLFTVVLIACFVISSLLGIAPNGVHSVRAASEYRAAPASAAASYGGLPMAFIANTGQSQPTVRFQVRGSGGTLSFEPDAVVLSLPALTPGPSPARGRGETGGESSPSTMQWERGSGGEGLRLTFLNANPNATITGADQLPGIANFFIGSDPSRWHTNVPTYAGVVYHDLYPGTDLAYAGHAGLLKGTYTLAAGTEPSLIHWRYEGANKLSLDPSTGNLAISAPDGLTLTEKAPVAWQMRAGAPTPVTVGYQLDADGAVQFALGDYDRALPLVIDPGLAYSTFVGSGGDDNATGIAVDTGGNAYITGGTDNAEFPNTVGGLFGGAYDAFVIKINPAGTALVYATYLGGSDSDGGNGIAVDATGNAYIVGSTYSADFPTTVEAYQTKFGAGTAHAVVSKLSATGSLLLYSTYVGGNALDTGAAIALDNNGNAYITGSTTGGFPVTPGAFQTTFGGGYTNAFVSKLSAGGSTLLYSTYLGGARTVSSQSIAVDRNGNAYITGSAQGGLPVRGKTFQTMSGDLSAFVSKLDATGSDLVYSIYLGTHGNSEGMAIALDAKGNAYVTGIAGARFPTTAGTFQTAMRGINDAFVCKLNAPGDALIYCTYVGTGDDAGMGITVDGSGNTYIVGYTDGPDFPTTTDAVQRKVNSGYHVFVSVINVTGSQLIYSTNLGGSIGEGGQGIALDQRGGIYITGSTNSKDFPTLAGGLQAVFAGGNRDAFVSKLTISASTNPGDLIVPATPVPGPTPTPENGVHD